MKLQAPTHRDLWGESSDAATAGVDRADEDTGTSDDDARDPSVRARPLWRDSVRMRDKLQRSLAAPSIAVIAVIILSLIISVTVVWAKPHEPSDPPEASGFSDSPEVPESQPESDTQSTAASQEVIVHVVGEVRDPGIVKLEQGARVTDAIEAAGGALDTAAIDALNLARVVADGEQIDVLDREGAADLATPPVAPTPSGSAATPSQAVPLNTADEKQLQELPGVGPALAARILEWRETNGSFSTIEQLMEVNGIGEKTFEKMRDQLAL